jgi:uncharacterized surface protein with fasciclin (FAS1) repeats
MATILEIAHSDKHLTLFAKGLKTAELDSKLAEIGPFTILGPVNLALGRLSALTYDELLEPANRDKLINLLSNYIIVGKKMFHDFRNDQKISMLNGRQVTVSVKNGHTLVDGAQILAHDKQGSNGVVHVLASTFQ